MVEAVAVRRVMESLAEYVYLISVNVWPHAEVL
jgi:hypothetical protein